MNIAHFIISYVISAWIASGITNLIYTIYKYKDEGKSIKISRILICIPIYIIFGPITLLFKK